MSTEPTQHEAASHTGTGEAWREIDQVVEELAELSESSADAAEFHKQVLDRVVGTLAAVGGAVWTRAADGDLRLAYQIKISAAGGMDDAAQRDRHEQIVHAALESKEPVSVAPQSGAPSAKSLSNPSDLLLVLCAWDGDAACRGVLEIFQRPGTSPAAQRGYAQFLQVVCQIVGDFHRNRQLADLHQLKDKWGRFERFSENVHRSLQLKETAYHIVNEARHYLDCDRVWVALGGGRRSRISAVSGVDTVNRRATVVRALERLCRVVIAAGEPLTYNGGDQDLPPEIETPLRHYIDTAHVRSVVIVPLTDPQPCKQKKPPARLGALVAERFFAEADERFQSSVRVISTHSQLALANALYVKQIPLASGLRQLGRVRTLFQAQRLPLTILLLCLVAVAVLALAFVPADFNVSTRGVLQPVERCHVFAPEDGVVAEVHVKHGDKVKEGEELMALTNPDLDLGFSRIFGELQTAQSRLATVEAERLQNPRETVEQRRRHNQLTAEKEELDELIANLTEQKEIVERRRELMKISSPLTGEVVSWNLSENLLARPIARGQEVLTVAALDGPWQLELQVPDKRIAHVLAAQKRVQGNLNVSFILAMDPRREHKGNIIEIGTRTEVSERDGAFVPVTVEIEHLADLPELVPGASVRAKIDCGRRAIGYVWLHDLIEAFQTWVAF
jgi:multidrug efflux pump subunit AcrA (membrane-fusion protein)